MKPIRLIALAAACIGLSAFANPVIDQNQPDFVSAFSNIGPGYEYYQSFQQSANNISGAGFYLGPFWGSPGTSTFTIRLFSDNPYTNPGSLVASGTGTGRPGDWVDAFWGPIAVGPSTTMYLSISNSDGDYSYATTFGYIDPYAFGSAGYQSNPVYASGIYDLTFRTYSESGSPGVPDGGLSVAMFGAAFTGLVALRRKSRA